MLVASDLQNPYLPEIATIEDIRVETPDVKTFKVVFDDENIRAGFTHKPGQCAMLSMFGIGEAMISITSSPTQKGYLEFSIKKMGRVTSEFHEAEPGQKIGIRAPLGNHFPVEEMKGHNLLFIGGGIGLAPLRSLINFVFDTRSDYGRVEIVYGARSPADLCFKQELLENWPQHEKADVHLTVDRGDENWEGHEGFVPAYLEEINPSPDRTVAILCGPPIMIKFVLDSLHKMGFPDEMIYTTLEMKMKCGIGKCGRCNIGDKYVCVDGPVFSMAQLSSLPDEY